MHLRVGPNHRRQASNAVVDMMVDFVVSTAEWVRFGKAIEWVLQFVRLGQNLRNRYRQLVVVE